MKGKSIHYFKALNELQQKERFYDFVDERVELSKNNLSCNCLGGALSGVGEVLEDSNMHPWDAKKVLDGLTEAGSASRGYLAVWTYQDDTPYHAAIVANNSGTKAISRNGGNNELKKDIEMNELSRIYDNYSGFRGKKKYFIPSKLQKIIDAETQQ